MRNQNIISYCNAEPLINGKMPPVQGSVTMSAGGEVHDEEIL